MDDKKQMQISTKTLLDRLESEKKEKLLELSKVDSDIATWEFRHKHGKDGYLTTKAYVERKLKEIADNIELAKKDTNPQLTLAIQNKERVKRGECRFSKGCAVSDDDVAGSIGDNQRLLAEKMGLSLIMSGKFMGLPKVCDLLAQLVCNALLIPIDKIRCVTPEEVAEAVSKWPKKS